MKETNQENYCFFMALYRKYRQAKRLKFTTESFAEDNWNVFFFFFSLAPKAAVGYCLFVTIQQNNVASGASCHLFMDYIFISFDYKNHTNDSASLLFLIINPQLSLII